MIYDFIKCSSAESLGFNENTKWTLLENISFFDNIDVDFEDFNIAIIGVEEDRGTPKNIGTKNAPDHIRRALYKLSSSCKELKVIDLGNIQSGAELKDSYYALSHVLEELLKAKVFTIILGGGQDLSLAQFNAYERIKPCINFVCIDESFDLDKSMYSGQSYLMDIFTKENNHLFHFSNIGYQSYFVHDHVLASLEKMRFDAFRLGYFKHNITETEVILRDADMISLDISSIKQSEAPAHKNASPNGFYSEEICQITRYAGISDKLSSFGFYELNPSFDQNNQSAMLFAQSIWYLLDGYINRHFEKPEKSNNNYIRYEVDSEEECNNLVFWKSKKSGRWWMEIPNANKDISFKKEHIVSCTYNDYQEACNGEIPNRWLSAYEKLS